MLRDITSYTFPPQLSIISTAYQLIKIAYFFNKTFVGWSNIYDFNLNIII